MLQILQEPQNALEMKTIRSLLTNHGLICCIIYNGNHKESVWV